MEKGQSLTAVCRHPRPDVMWPSCIFVMMQNVPHLFCFPTFAVSPSRQTRRMQAKTSVRNNASVFLNTTSLLRQVKKPKQCIVMSLGWDLESGFMFWNWNLLYLSHFQLSIFVLHSPHSLPFSRSIFSCSHLCVTPNFSTPSFTVFLSSSYSFSFQFPFSAIFLPFLPFQMETKSETYFALFINALNGHL